MNAPTSNGIKCATFSKERLEALTDGIYAVALTLLVLNLKLPSTSVDSVQFVSALFVHSNWKKSILCHHCVTAVLHITQVRFFIFLFNINDLEWCPGPESTASWIKGLRGFGE
jgi:uncharacterized membrane protein